MRLAGWLRLTGLTALLAAGVSLGDTPAFAVKAAYLYHFTTYMEWPEGSFARPDSPLVIGVLDDDDVASQLERTLAGQSVAGHPMQVRRLRGGEALAGLHLLLIGHTEGSAAATLATAAGLPLVTVTESEADYAEGSMINFVTADNRVRFEVTLGPAEAAHIKISARMLTAALSVRRQP